MPFVPPVPAYVTRTVVIQITGPKDAALVKQLNKDLKKLARKYGAILKTTAKSRRRKVARAKRKRS